jgi:DNA-binding HxlR family transcriptional regulator
MLQVTDEMLSNRLSCPIRNVLDRIGDKWSLLVLISLAGQKRNFMSIKRVIGDITQKVLSETLKKLERDGYVSRTVIPTTPPTVDYNLSDMGNSIVNVMGSLVLWANENYPAIEQRRELYDKARI